MSSLLRIDNFPQTNIKELAQLVQDYEVGSQTLAFISAVGVSVGDVVFLGALGQETAERLVVQSITLQTITFTTPTVFKHYANEPASSIKGDQIRIYTAPNVDGSVPADSVFTRLDTVPIDLDNNYTEYTDPNGSSSVWYKATFYATGYETSLADSVAQRGGGYGGYASVEQVRDEAGMSNNPWIPNSSFAERIIAAQDRINGFLRGAYKVPFDPYVPEQIVQIARLMAAGMILDNEYGVQTKGSTKDGSAKIKEAEDMLLDIREGYTTLLDQGGNSLRLDTSFSSYPNNNTAFTDPVREQSQDGSHLASMDDIY